MHQVRALIVDDLGGVRIQHITPDLAGMKALVGGWLEAITPAHYDYGDWHGYVDEEGKNKGLPANPVATAVAHGLGWPGGDMLCGPLVILGVAGEGEDYRADEADVPDVTLLRVLEIVGERTLTWWGSERHADVAELHDSIQIDLDMPEEP